jgi:hypothetical protein
MLLLAVVSRRRVIPEKPGPTFEMDIVSDENTKLINYHNCQA